MSAAAMTGSAIFGERSRSTSDFAIPRQPSDPSSGSIRPASSRSDWNLG